MMASDAVFTFTDENFDDEALRCEMPVLIDFWSEQCMPCRMLTPIIDKLAEQYAGRVKIGKMDTAEFIGVASRYGIQAIPHVMLINNGGVVTEFRGLQPERDYIEAIESLLS